MPEVDLRGADLRDRRSLPGRPLRAPTSTRPICAGRQFRGGANLTKRDPDRRRASKAPSFDGAIMPDGKRRE